MEKSLENEHERQEDVYRVRLALHVFNVHDKFHAGLRDYIARSAQISLFLPISYYHRGILGPHPALRVVDCTKEQKGLGNTQVHWVA